MDNLRELKLKADDWDFLAEGALHVVLKYTGFEQ